MTKSIIFIFILFSISYTLPVVYAMDPADNRDNKKVKFQPSSTLNWVHPKIRESYKGYEKFKIQQQLSPMWQYSTNRPSGNIKGGGTTKYQDYTPFYSPSQKSIKKN